MQMILDVKSDSGVVLRFIFTHKGEETVFKTIRTHDMLTVTNRGKKTTDRFFKNHGSLLVGDAPEIILSTIKSKSNEYTPPISTKTVNLIKNWVQMCTKQQSPEISIQTE